MHRQLLHASKDKLKKLAQQSQIFDDAEFLKTIVGTVENLKYKPPLNQKGP